MIQRTVRRRHGRRYAPPGGKRLSLLIDDVNAPSPDQFGDQPAAEVCPSHIYNEILGTP
jgi:hypothetical protein